MEIKTNIRSTVKPEINSSDDKYVYERSNIQKIVEIDPVFQKDSVLYSYDETRYTWEEWNKICIDKLTKKIDDLETRISKLERVE